MAELHIKKKKYTNKEKELITQYYPDLDELQKLLPNRSRKAIILKAYNMGLSTKRERSYTDEENKIIKKYYPTCGALYIQNNFIKDKSIKSIQQQAFKLKVKYLTYDENYFEIIDSSEKAYWIGFIYADGYVNNNDNRFGIELALVDYKHLQNLLDLMKSNLKIKTRNRINRFNNKNKENLDSCSITINNKKIHTDLINKGVIPNKTYNLTFPSEDILPEEYLFDFIRGFIDGDGTIGLYTSTNGYTKPHISLICKSKEFLVVLQNKLKKYNIEIYLSYKKSNDMYRLMVENKNTVINLLKLLYKNSNYKSRLERKYKKAIKIFDYYNIEI